MTPCGHPLCALIEGPCSLAVSVGRGCRSGPGPSRVIAAAVFDEVAALVAIIDRSAADDRPRARIAATRLAEIIRREARDDRHVLAMARADELELVPSLARLCALSAR